MSDTRTDDSIDQPIPGELFICITSSQLRIVVPYDSEERARRARNARLNGHKRTYDTSSAQP